MLMTQWYEEGKSVLVDNLWNVVKYPNGEFNRGNLWLQWDKKIDSPDVTTNILIMSYTVSGSCDSVLFGLIFIRL